MDNNMILNNGFNELIFENRHKDYGAYQIRRRYKRNVFLASLISISIFPSGIFLYFIFIPNAMAEVPKEKPVVQILSIDNSHIVDPVKPIKPEIPVVHPPKGPNVSQLTNPLITNQVVETHPIDSSGTSLKGIPDGTGTKVDTSTNVGNVVAKRDSTPPAPKRVNWVPQDIKDPGLDAYFQKCIRYPEELKEADIEGTEYLEFVIDIHGNPKEFKIVKSSNSQFANEVLRVAPGMPKFDPITFQGEPVEMVMHKPIHFLLSK